jgi:nitric oxide reductase activation protein
MSLLIDMSESTSERVPGAKMTIAEAEKLAVAMLASGMEAAGDTFALYAFASDGRHNVRFLRIKEFNECFDRTAKARLEGLRPGLSTRLGTALRHAGAELSSFKAHRKIILTLTDGSPSDVDVADPLDLVEDARRAVLALRTRGIDVFGILLDPAGVAKAGPPIFEHANTLAVRRIEELPRRLSQIYFRLTRR